MRQTRIFMIGIVVGVIAHIMQGFAAYALLDRYYLANPELVRDSSKLVALYYLALNIIVGLIITYLSYYLKQVWQKPGWAVGLRTGMLIWAASSPVYIFKRQIILNLPQMLLLEAVTDGIIYAVIGMIAGALCAQFIPPIKKENNS